MSYKTLFGKSQVVAKAASQVRLSESQMSLRNQLRTGIQMLKKDKEHPPKPVAMPEASATNLSSSEPQADYQEELEPWREMADDTELSDIRDGSLNKNENLVDQSRVKEANAKLGDVWNEAKRKLNKKNENKKDEKN